MLHILCNAKIRHLFDTAKYFERFLQKGCHMGAVTVMKTDIENEKNLAMDQNSPLLDLIVFPRLSLSEGSDRTYCFTEDIPRKHRVLYSDNAHLYLARERQSSYLCFLDVWLSRWQRRLRHLKRFLLRAPRSEPTHDLP